MINLGIHLKNRGYLLGYIPFKGLQQGGLNSRYYLEGSFGSDHPPFSSAMEFARQTRKGR